VNVLGVDRHVVRNAVVVNVEIRRVVRTVNLIITWDVNVSNRGVLKNIVSAFRMGRDVENNVNVQIVVIGKSDKR
jgi:hypothetical protein